MGIEDNFSNPGSNLEGSSEVSNSQTPETVNIDEAKTEQEKLEVTNRIAIFGAHGSGVSRFRDALELFYPVNKKAEKPDITFTTKADDCKAAIYNQIPREVKTEQSGIDRIFGKKKTVKEVPSEGPTLPKRIIVFPRMSTYDDTGMRVNSSPLGYIREISEKYNIPMTVVGGEFNNGEAVKIAQLVEQVIKEDQNLGIINLEEGENA
jgi:hypothetical protein